MKGVLGSIRKRNADDFMSRVEEGDNDNDGAEQQTTMVELAQRLPTVISFNCTVKRKIGRARRDLTLDLDKLTVTQTGGTARKVLHCHKFVSLVPASANVFELQATILEPNSKVGGEGGKRKAQPAKCCFLRAIERIVRRRYLIRVCLSSVSVALSVCVCWARGVWVTPCRPQRPRSGASGTMPTHSDFRTW